MKLPFKPESEVWLASLTQAGASVSTIDCYERDLRDIAAAVAGDSVIAITRINQLAIDRIAAIWNSDGTAASTVYRRFSCLRTFAKFLSRERTCDCSKILSSRFPPCGRVAREAIAQDSIEMILSSSEPDRDDVWTRIRDCAAVHVAAASGLTTAELVGLNQSDFKPNLSAVVVRGSRLNERPAAISQQAAHWLSHYLSGVPFDLCPDDPLFVTSRRTRVGARSLQLAFRRFRNLAGVPQPAVLSSLRNSIGLSLARSGSSPEVLAAALGISVASAWRFCKTQEIT